MPGDANKDNVYEVTITATDRESNIGTSGRKGDGDERQRERHGHPESETQPRVGLMVTADFADADGGERVESWQWWRSDSNTLPTQPTLPTDLANLSDNWEMVEGAMSATYTPVEDADGAESDVGRYLMAVVTYTDAHETMDDSSTTNVDESKAKDLAGVVSANAVDRDTRNKAPVFRNDDGAMIASTTRDGGGGL